MSRDFNAINRLPHASVAYYMLGAWHKSKLASTDHMHFLDRAPPVKRRARGILSSLVGAHGVRSGC